MAEIRYALADQSSEAKEAAARHQDHGPLCYCAECLPHPKQEEPS